MPALQNLARAIRPHPDNDGTVERRCGTLTAVWTYIWDGTGAVQAISASGFTVVSPPV